MPGLRLIARAWFYSRTCRTCRSYLSIVLVERAADFLGLLQRPDPLEASKRDRKRDKKRDRFGACHNCLALGRPDNPVIEGFCRGQLACGVAGLLTPSLPVLLELLG